jgi:hypothetical protein
MRLGDGSDRSAYLLQFLLEPAAMKSQMREMARDLVVEAGQAADPATNGLLNRTDLEEMISRLRSLAEELLANDDRLQRQRDSSLARLRRTRVSEQITRPNREVLPTPS